MAEITSHVQRKDDPSDNNNEVQIFYWPLPECKGDVKHISNRKYEIRTRMHGQFGKQCEITFGIPKKVGGERFGDTVTFVQNVGFDGVTPEALLSIIVHRLSLEGKIRGEIPNDLRVKNAMKMLTELAFPTPTLALDLLDKYRREKEGELEAARRLAKEKAEAEEKAKKEAEEAEKKRQEAEIAKMARKRERKPRAKKEVVQPTEGQQQ